MKITPEEVVDLLSKINQWLITDTSDLSAKVQQLEKQNSAQDGIIIILKEQRDNAFRVLSEKGLNEPRNRRKN